MSFLKAIVIPDKFKGTLSAKAAGEIIKEGIISVMPSCRVLRLSAADGGEGTIEAYLDNVGGKTVCVPVLGPNGQAISAELAVLENGCAVIEMARASGLAVAEAGSSPLYTDTRGTGMLIKAALDMGCRRIIIGIGGSATNDGGAGMAAALGVRFLDGEGKPIPTSGAGLARLERVDVSRLDSRIAETEILAACDVDNPLCGEQGAARVFARQKGADDAAIEQLDRNLHHLAEVVARQTGKDMLTLKGGGAAGGLGAGLCTFLGARLVSGAELLLRLCDFERQAADADLIITGEGCFDSQSLHGKLPMAIAAHSCGKPVAVVAGRVRLSAEEIENAGLFCAEQSAPEGLDFEEIKTRCRADLYAAAQRVARRYYDGKRTLRAD